MYPLLLLRIEIIIVILLLRVEIIIYNRSILYKLEKIYECQLKVILTILYPSSQLNSEEFAPVFADRRYNSPAVQIEHLFPYHCLLGLAS